MSFFNSKMVKWGDLENEAERKRESERLENERKRREEEAKQKKEEQERRKKEELEEARKKLAEERWGTPKRAYATWEARAKAIVEMVNELVREYRQTSESNRARYRNLTFNVYGFSGLFSVAFERAKVVETFTLDDLTLHYDSDKRKYSITRNGELLLLNDTVELLKDTKFGLETVKEVKKYGDHSQLEEAIKGVFIPQVAANSIEEGRVSLGGVKEFFEYAHLLRGLTSGNVTYNCSYKGYEYESNSAEDVDVNISIPFQPAQSSSHRQHQTDSVSVTIPNPRFYGKSYMERLVKNYSQVYLHLYAPTRGGGCSHIMGP